MNKEKLYVPIAILIVGVVLGTSIVSVQVLKQKSIERQQQRELLSKEELDSRRIKEDRRNAELLDDCLAGADSAYWNYVENNMEEKKDGTYFGENWRWDEAQSRKDAKEKSCFTQYK